MGEALRNGLPHISGTIYETDADDNANLNPTEKRLRTAKRIGRTAHREKGLVEGYLAGIRDGFTDASDERRQSLLKKQERLNHKVDLVRQALQKPIPDQSETYRHRLSEVTTPTTRNYAGGSPTNNPASQRITAIQDNLHDLRDDDSWILNGNIAFKKTNDTGDSYNTDEALLRLSGGLEELRYQAQRDEEHGATKIKSIHARTDHELINSAAQKTNVDIQRKPEDVTQRYNVPRKQPRDLLTKPTTSSTIGLAEHGRPGEYDHDHATWQDAREQHFKDNILSDDEREQYERDGEWLPRDRYGGTSLPNDAADQLKNAFTPEDEYGNE